MSKTTGGGERKRAADALGPPPPTMRAALLTRPGAPLEIRETPTPRPGPGELLVRLEACGVCHTDLHIRDGEESVDPADLPLILGHEGVGRVVALGDDAGDDADAERGGGYAIGDRVGLPWLAETCLACRPCRTGRETACASQRARGLMVQGAFADYALVRADFTAPIPEAIPAIAAAPLLCAGLTAWGALEKAAPSPGETCLIVGCGGLGQYAIQIARARGARVIAVDARSDALAQARALGAEEAVLAGDGAAERIADLGGADVAVNFAPTNAVWPLIAAAMNPLSRVVLVGLGQEPIALAPIWLIDGGRRVMGSSVGGRQELRDFFAFAAARALRAPTRAIALEDVEDALSALRDGTAAARAVIDFSL